MGSGSGRHRNHVRPEARAFINEARKAVAVVVGREVSDLDIAPISIPEVLQAFEKPVEARGPRPQAAGVERQKAEPRGRTSLLGLSQGPGQESENSRNDDTASLAPATDPGRR